MKNLTLLLLPLVLSINSLNAADGDSVVNVTFDASYQTAEGWVMWSKIPGFTDPNFGFINPTGETVSPLTLSNSGVWIGDAQYSDDAWITYTASGLTIGDHYKISVDITSGGGWGGTSYAVNAWEPGNKPAAISVASMCDICDDTGGSHTLEAIFTAYATDLVFGIGAGKANGVWYERTVLESFSVIGTDEEPPPVEVDVHITYEGINLDEIYAGLSYSFDATTEPANYPGTVSWSIDTSSTSEATLTDGVLTATTEGSLSIIASINHLGIIAKDTLALDVMVIPPPTIEITHAGVNIDELTAGLTYIFRTTIIPLDYGGRPSGKLTQAALRKELLMMVSTPQHLKELLIL